MLMFPVPNHLGSMSEAFLTPGGLPRQASQVVLVIKNLPANVEDASDVGSIPGSGRSPGVRNGTQFQYSGLENFLGRGPWRATISGAAKSQT